MGMYTEFYFRAVVKEGPVADWLDQQINGGDDDPVTPYDDSEFFQDGYWQMIFWGSGAVYQESRPPIFRRATERYESTWLVIASSMKHSVYIDRFITWIAPHLRQSPGDFLGYKLFEDSRPCGLGWGNPDRQPEPDREQPTLIFMPEAAP